MMRIAVVCVLVVALVAGCGEEVPSSGTSTGSGAWRELPIAPIGTRPHAVSGWSGSEAVFWAGSNLERSFAHTDGAAFDPESDTWRELDVPGWGHPGLVGVVHDSQMFVAAKGGGSRIDLTNGAGRSMASVNGFVLAQMVLADGEVWGLGPVAGDVSDIGVARYDPSADFWVSGPGFEVPADSTGSFDGPWFGDQPVVWTGSEIVLWQADGTGTSFDPEAESWRILPTPVPAGVRLIDSEVAEAGAGLAVLAMVDRAGETAHGLAEWNGSVWTWDEIELDIVDFTTVSIAGAGDWIMVFSPESAPVGIHVPSAAATVFSDAPVGPIHRPNVVWTGTELVVWGGTIAPGDPMAPSGGVWRPPSS